MIAKKNIVKILAIAALSLNLLQAKATLSIDGYMPKMLFMKVKDGGTVYVDDEKKGMTSASGPLIVQIAEGEHNVKVCFPNEKNNMLRICGEQKVYVADDTQASVSIKAERSQSLTDLEKCQDGDFKICTELGNAYYNGDGVAKNLNKSVDLYQKACDGGEINGCFNLGNAYYNGDGVTKDFNKAAQLYQKACDSKNMYGCNNLGNAYDNGDGVTKDFNKAAQLYQKACDGGNMEGCSNLGNAYYNGNGVTKDF
ncbi:tetratricopeptide repeat protein, partial [Campylobacter concisus]